MLCEIDGQRGTETQKQENMVKKNVRQMDREEERHRNRKIWLNRM